MHPKVWAILAITFGSATPSAGAVHRVPLEFPTIQAGIDACAEGDTVLVAPGTYTGPDNRNLDFHGINLVLRSKTGAAATVIDCQGDGQNEGRGFHFASGESSDARVEGFTVRNGFVWESGGGIFCVDASPRLTDVLLENCVAAMDGAEGGGAHFVNSQSLLQNVSFIANRAWGHTYPGGLAMAAGGGLYARNCQLSIVGGHFLDNRVTVGGEWECCSFALGGGICVDGGSIEVLESLFAGNRGEGGLVEVLGGGIYVEEGEVAIEHCTFVGNYANSGAAVFAAWHADQVTLDASVIAFNTGGEAVTSTVLASCCAFWSNGGTDAAHVGQNGSFLADPLFCDLAQGDYRLGPGSPCLPENNECGVLIGAFGAGCDETTVMLASFSAHPRAGGVDLDWQAFGVADFILRGERGSSDWIVDWEDAGGGRYIARDLNSELALGGEVLYQLEGREQEGDWQLLGQLTVVAPSAFGTRLFAPHPNPCKPGVALVFTLAEPAPVRLEIFDLSGRRIATLAEASFPAGRHALAWDGRDRAGKPQASGVYCVRFASPGRQETQRLVLMR